MGTTSYITETEEFVVVELPSELINYDDTWVMHDLVGPSGLSVLNIEVSISHTQTNKELICNRTNRI